MLNGWVKLPRKLLESHILCQPELLQIFIYAILQARFTSTVVEFNRCTVALEPGQCIFGRSEWAFKLHLSESKVYKSLRKLAEYGYIKTKTTTKYTIVTIVGWESYSDAHPEQAFEQQADNKQTDQTIDIKGVEGGDEQQNGQQKNSKLTQIKKDNNLNNNIYNTAFEKFWKKYPNKFNRTQTHKNFVKAAKAHGVEAIIKALDCYLAEIEAEGTAAEFLIRSTNFVGQKAYYLGYLEKCEDMETPSDASESVTVEDIAKEWGYNE